MKKIFVFAAVFSVLSSWGLCSCDAEEQVKLAGDVVEMLQTTSPPDTNAAIPAAAAAPAETTSQEDRVEYFCSLVSSSEYANAIEYYAKNIKGNFASESAAADAILDLCTDLNADVLLGNTDKKAADIQIGVIDKVVEGVDLSIYGYEEVKEEIADSLASKAAYIAASELQKLTNYTDALKEYAKVIEEDSNYSAAQSAIAECRTLLKTETFSKAENLAASRNFSEAISCLTDLLAVFPDDEEVNGKISVYTRTHIRTAVTDAENAFVDVDDYSKALEYINSALQFYPDNEELLAKKDYYNSFAPVKLESLPKYDTSGKYGPTFLESEKDPLGNVHTDVFRTWSYMYEYAWVVYNLNGEYNKLTFTVYGTQPSDNEIASVSIRDYSKGDYDLSTVLYVDETLKRSVFPYEVDVDVTGVQMIRVYVKHGIAVADAVVQRTVK